MQINANQQPINANHVSQLQISAKQHKSAAKRGNSPATQTGSDFAEKHPSLRFGVKLAASH
jgi:hypothetical protein